MDRNIVQIRGAHASIKWGYHVAATVAAWSFTGSGQGGTVSATIETRDAFRLRQSPLVLVLMLDGLPVKWPVLGLDEDGPTVRVVVGPKD